ncbi:MAG: metal-dependent hydrolase [Candidatus Hodarchaeota archaeon]
MLASGHLFIAVILGTALMYITGIVSIEGLIVVMISGILPDLDGLLHFIQGKKYDDTFRHHTWPTHTFFLYFIVFLIIFLLGFPLFSLLFLIGTFSHLLEDMVGSGDGINIFWPFSKKMFGIHLLNAHGSEWLEKYLSFWYFRWIERIAIFLGLFCIFMVGMTTWGRNEIANILWPIIMVFSLIGGIVAFKVTLSVPNSSH